MTNTKLYYILTLILLAGISATSYYLGYKEGERVSRESSVYIDYVSIPKEHESIKENIALKRNEVVPPPTSIHGPLFGSKSGTKYYASNSCAHAKRIKPENYVYFKNAEEAQLQGYTKGQC